MLPFLVGVARHAQRASQIAESLEEQYLNKYLWIALIFTWTTFNKTVKNFTIQGST